MSNGMGIGRNCRLTIAAAIVTAVGLAVIPPNADARGGVSTGEAIGIGVGSFALGTALGAASNPNYAPGYYPPANYAPPPPPAYYAPNPYAPRSCWDAYYRRYYAC